jgi:hypothetical protein
MSRATVEPSVSVEATGAIAQLQAQGVRIPSPESVVSFLTVHPELLPLLTPIADVARRYLPDAELSLEHYVDPEIDDQYLALYARFAEYGEDILRRIERAREECESLWRGAPDLIFITTDFKPPYGI